MTGAAKLRRRGGLAATALVALLGALSGCGVSAQHPESSGAEGSVVAGKVKPAAAVSTLPPRPVGELRLEGVVPGSLAAKLLKGYREAGTSLHIHAAEDAEGAAFEALCAGATDIVSSQAPIPAEVYPECQANGIEPVQIQIGADAAILAIANETNVGVDCISVGDAREIFRAASPVTSWSQVGYGHGGAADAGAPRLQVTGPEPSSGLLGAFSEVVLGDAEPSRLLLRGDYEAHMYETEVLDAVSGGSEQAELAAHAEEFGRSAKQLGSALRSAEKAVEEAEFQVEKGIEDERSEAEQEADAATLAEAEEKVEALGPEMEEAEATAANAKQAKKQVEGRLGTLGLFRFGFYELYEERLRPMEIEATDSEAHPECVFPSQATATDGSYPLSHQLLLTVDLATMKEAEVSQFLAFALEGAQEAASAQTLVPLTDEVKDTELAWLRGEVPPDVVYYPPARIAEAEARAQAGGETS
jgi:ABC-type phosphate transport system substrate-binding protein